MSFSFSNPVIIDELYALVLDPELQGLTEYDWFRSECVIFKEFADHPYLSTAYFVPLRRLIEINQPGS